MAILLSLLLTFGFIAIGPFLLLLFAITVAMYFGKERRPPQDPYCTTSFAILVPAHNEESSIGATVENLSALDYPADRFEVVVIADNCSDSTAEVAKAKGATVIERFDTDNKSKGYALEYALSKLGAYEDDNAGPDPVASATTAGATAAARAFVVIDADSIADAALLRRLNDHHQAGHDWVQAYYTSSNPDDTPYTRMLTYAFALFNGSWQLGLSLLGFSASFRGCGMSFSQRGLSRQPFNVYGLTEDLEFSWRLRAAGEQVAFMPYARVYGEMVRRQDAAAQSQRIRWEQGRAALKKDYSGKIRTAPELSLLEKFVYLTDLYMLPLSKFLAVLLGLTAAAAAFQVLVGGALFWLALAFISLAIFGLYSITPFFRLDLPIGYLAALVKLPGYVVWKLLLFFKKDQKAWVRTKRNSEN